MKNAKTKYDGTEAIPVKHEFTTEELATLARVQGQLYQELEQLEGQKSHVAKEYAARIEGKSSELELISNKTASGYEMRRTDCGFRFRPADKAKDYFTLETGIYVETRSMQLTDYQKEMPLEKPADDFGDDPKPDAA